MDADRFDTLARVLQTTPTRRLTLGALTALGLAALLGDAETDARRKGKKGKGRRRKGVKCDGKDCKKDDPPVNLRDCIYGGHHSGCTNVAGKPCCYNFECRACAPEGNCGCTEPKMCSAGSTENVCIDNPF